MADRRAKLLGTALITLIMVVSSLGLLGAFSGVAAAHPTSPAGAVSITHSATNAPAKPTGPATVNPAVSKALSPSGLTAAAPNPMATSALAAAAADGISTRDIFVPRAGASPTQIAQAQAQGHVTPLYSQVDPSPIGLAYYGLSANPNGNGSIVATTLQTSSLYATVDTNAQGIVPEYPFSSSPDGYGIQLNAVSTSINLFGNSSYSFWSQNVFEFLPSIGEVYLVTNIWNFSGGGLSANAIYAHGSYGTVVPGELYYAEKILTGVTYPLDLGLWMNNSVVSGRNEISFTVSLTTGGTTNVYPYDYVIFNSTSAAPSMYTADGTNYNALGLTNDFELILGGPGGGSQADLFGADANLTLDYWNATAGAYQATPAAYSYGGETGETVTGGYVGWETNATGSPYGVLRAGPGMLQGLWNATGAEGLTKVTVSISPTNGFYFIAPNWTSNFSFQGDPYWAPQELDGSVFWLAPGDYNLTVVLANYDPVEGAITVGTTPLTVSATLTQNAALGLYTPLWVWENSQFADMSTGGTGTASDPYQIINTQPYAFGSIFGFFNDYTFPVFNGVFFWGTTASVVMSNMPAMETDMPYLYFPSTNDLSYQLVNTQNVALVNSTNISGWFSSNVQAPLYEGSSFPFAGTFYGTFSIETWNASNTLIANNTFRTQAAGALLVNGGNNTVWGNDFTMVAQPNFSSTLLGFGITPLNLSLGLQESEGNDLVYNNIFTTTLTAINPPINLYNDNIVYWQNTWNITPTPAATVNYASGFPWFPLTGTIIGNATQGGNSWWDYGTANNPIGVLPYDEYEPAYGVAQIYVGGDYYPLINPNYTVTFTEGGLGSGTLWSVTVAGIPYSSIGTTISLNLTNGTYDWSTAVTDGLTPSPSSGTVVVAGTSQNVDISFSAPSTYDVTFDETGLTAGTEWSVTIGTTPYPSATSTVVVPLVNGTYDYTVAVAGGYTPAPAAGTFNVNGANVGPIDIVYSPPTSFTVTFTESGLTTGTNWSVTFNGVSNWSLASTITFSASNGSYIYSIPTVAGYNANPSSGTLAVHGTTNQNVDFTTTGPTTYQVTFTETGLTAGTSWSIAFNGAAPVSSGTDSITFNEVNGSYTYTIEAVSGYTLTASTPTSPLTVAGANVPVTVTFAAASTTYSITFTETGLPSSSEWGVALDSGTPMIANAGESITFSGLVSGSYSFLIEAQATGYSSTTNVASPLTLSNANVAVSVTFTQSSGPSGSGSSGLSTLDWILIGVVLLIVVIGLVAALSMRRRGGGGSATSTPSDTGSENAPAEGETSYGDSGSGGGGN